MELVSDEVFEGLRELDTATIFNAVIEARGASQGGRELEGQGGMPLNYMAPGMHCMLPQHGMAIGYAATCEMTTHDPDGPSIPMYDYYDHLDATPGPMVAIIKDVDTIGGRGASLGDGMAATHKHLGVTGIVVDGSIRDLAGIERVGLPVWGTGVTPGHGILTMVRQNEPIVVNELIIHPGEIVAADRDGVVKIPAGDDVAKVLEKGREIQERENAYHAIYADPNLTWEGIKEYHVRMQEEKEK